MHNNDNNFTNNYYANLMLKFMPLPSEAYCANTFYCNLFRETKPTSQAGCD